MDAANLELAKGLVSASYITQGAQALAARRRRVKALLSSRRLPQEGWDDATIEMLLRDAALMDANNFPGAIGVGEREGRVACGLVARRHYLLAHGVGRSGDVTAEQPKAAGSSLLAKLAAALAGDALRVAGLAGMAPPVVLPLATGMAMTMTLLAAASARGPGARHVVWSRIDQKTCLKAVAAANLVPVVVELVQSGDELVTDVAGIEAAVARVGADSVAAVVTTSSCFAPRAPDDVVAVAKACARLGVPHIINNAYGVQARATCAAVAAAARRGRVDAVVQSTDKNFLVPVGGALVAAPAAAPWLADAVAAAYPGRASASAMVDLLATLLHLGADGWAALLAAREAAFDELCAALEGAAASVGERLLRTPSNPISLAVTLGGLDAAAAAAEAAAAKAAGAAKPRDASYLGAMLWARGVSGARVVARGRPPTSVAGVSFEGYGGHAAGGCVQSYVTAAAAIGAPPGAAAAFAGRLERAYRECLRQMGRAAGGCGDDDGGGGEDGGGDEEDDDDEA